MMTLLSMVLCLSLLKVFLPLTGFFAVVGSERHKRLLSLTVEVSGIALILVSGRYTVLWPKEDFLPGLGLGLLLGIGSLVGAFYLTRFSFKATYQLASELQNIPAYIATRRLNVLRQLFVAMKEELLWRGTIQFLLGNTGLSVFVTACLFTFIHFDTEKDPIVIMDYLELFLFALILGTLFFAVENIYAVIAMHAVRNVGILSIKQLK